MRSSRLLFFSIVLIMSFGIATAQNLPVCDVTCTPDPNAPNYGGAAAARPKLLNARGFSSPFQAIAGPKLVPMIVGSQSYNYVIPILSLPGRAGMDLNLNLYYNSRVWDIDTVNGVVTFNADRDFPSYGFRLDFGFLEYVSSGDMFILTERDGTKRALINNGGYNSTDGSYINYNRTTKVLTYKNGMAIQYSAFPSNANLLRPIQLKDTNGNYISITYVSGHDQLIQSITDTVNRTINFHYDSNNQLSYIDQNVAISSVDPTGIHRYVTFAWASPGLYGTGSAWYSFSGLTVNGAPALSTPLPVLTGCTYANGTGYRFTYGDWAIINKIESLSATGVTRSYASYNYPLASAGAQTDAPTYTQETISPDNASTSVWGYQATKAGTGVVTSMKVTDAVTGAANNVTVTNLDPATGLLSSVQTENSSGAVLRTITYAWTTSGGANVPSSITTTLNDTGQQSSVQYSNYDTFGNAGDIYEYDFGGTLLRHTATTYATTFGAQHILNLPLQILVKDGSGTTVARTDFAYDSTIFLPSITDAANHDNSVTGHGNLTSITRYSDAAGGTGQVVHQFFIDNLGNVRTVQLDCCVQKAFNFSIGTQYAYPDSAMRGPSDLTFTTSATWNTDKGLMLTSTDENNQVTQYQYDSMNRLIGVTQPPQGSTSVQFITTYDDNAASPTVTNSATPSTVSIPTTVTTLDGLGHVLQVDTKNGATTVSSTTTSYDKVWRRSQQSNPFAPGDTPVYTSFSYDPLGRTTQVTPHSGGYAQYSYSGNAITTTDPAGKQRINYFDASDRLVRVDEPGETALAGTASAGYLNVNGVLRSQSGVGAHGAAQASASVAIWSNDPSGGDTHIDDPSEPCPPLPQTCPQIYDRGSVTVTVNGTAYSVNYGQFNTDTGIASSLAGLINGSSLVTASSTGTVITITARTAGAAGNSITLSASSTTSDAGDFGGPSFGGNASGANLANGSDASAGTTVYDMGTVNVTVGSAFTASASYSQSGNSTAAQIATALAGTGSTGLNRAGSPVSATVSGATILITYLTKGAATNVAVTAASTSTQTQYSFPGGSFNGAVTLIGGADPHSNSSISYPYFTTYSYDAVDHLTGVLQASGSVNGVMTFGQPRSYSYDGLGRLVSSTTPESGTVANYYTTSSGTSCAGSPSLPCRIQDARGVVKNLSYDDINRLKGVTYTNDPANTPPVSYQYDTGGAAAFALDRLTSITEGPATPTPINSHTFTYDNLGRITKDTQSIDQQTYVIQYAYNLAGQLASITYPSGHVVAQNYDAIGRLCSIGASGSTCTSGTQYLNNLTYNAAGEALGLTMGNGVQGAFTYNDHLQLASLRYFKSGASPDILNLGYDYTSAAQPNNNGQIQTMHYYTQPGAEDLTKSESFTYDPLGRLQAAQTLTVNGTAGTWSLQWTYDRFGNRLAQSLVGGNVSIGQPNFTVDPATNRITNSGYTYDAAGNMTHDAATVYAYDGTNRLTSINGTAAVYTYFGPQRIKKVVGSTTTRYIYAGSKVIAEYTGTTPALSTEYIYIGSQLLATISGTTTTYHHPDHLSNRAETDSSGNLTRAYGHFPFGETWYETGTANKWKFTSYEHDSATGETGLDYANFRYSATGQGRFMSADLLAGRIASPQSLNRYSYPTDPVNLVDPLGLFCQVVFQLNVQTDRFNDEPRGGPQVSVTPLLECTDDDDNFFGGGGNGGNSNPGGDPNLRFRITKALINSDCAALFGGLANAMKALLNTTYYNFTSGMNNPNPGLIDFSNWLRINNGFGAKGAFAVTLHSLPGDDLIGETFFGPKYFGLPSGFGASGTKDLGKETIELHELEHVANQTDDIDKTQQALDTSYTNINTHCNSQDIPLIQTPQPEITPP